jgi:hypothetical protein
MILAEEKQFTKIIRSRMFIIENNLWLFARFKILELAIIINAAIKILKIISVVDMVSIDENEVIDKFVCDMYDILMHEVSVMVRSEAIVTHQ